MKRIIALCLALLVCFTVNTQIANAQEHIVLTDTNPDFTITTGSTATVYGTAGVNKITIESGANVKLVNFPGSNTITIKGDSSNFTVSRSGAVVTFQGADGTVVKMPATLTSQIISFSNCQSGLVINAGRVKLGEQVVSSVSSAVSSCAASGLAETLSPQIVFTEEKGVFILGDTISWHLEMDSVPYKVKWSIDGQSVQQDSFTPAEVGSYRLNAEITLSVTNEVINAARTILVDEMTPIASVQAGSEGGELLVLDTDSGLDGARIEVPAGAVAANTEIVLSRATIDAMPYTGSEPLSPVLELQPAGTVFSKPVRIRIPFDPEQIEAGTDILIERLSDGQLDHLNPLMIDTQAKEIVFETEHFSVFRLTWSFKGGDKTENAEQIIKELREFMQGSKEPWKENFTDEELGIILNRRVDSSGITPYDLFNAYMKMKKAYDAAQNGSHNALSTTIRKLYPKASSFTELSKTIANLKPFIKPGTGVSGLAGRFLLAQFATKLLYKFFYIDFPVGVPYTYLGNTFDIGYLWATFSENQCLGNIAEHAKDWVYTGQGLENLMNEFKQAGFTDDNYWPTSFGHGTCGDMPKRTTFKSLKDNLYQPIHMFWETVKAFENGKVYDNDGKNAETALKDTILAAAQDPSSVGIKNKFSSNNPLFSIDDDELEKLNPWTSYLKKFFIVSNAIQSLSINVTPYSLYGTPMDYYIDDIIIDYEIGDEIKDKSPIILLKPGVHNIFSVRAHIHYFEYDYDGNSVRKDTLAFSTIYDVFRKGSKKGTYISGGVGVGNTTATSGAGNTLKAEVKSKNFISDNDSTKTTDTRSATVVSEIPKASYAIDIKCGSYSYQVGSDGKLIVPASQAEDSALSNCSARVYGTGAETDEDEIVESTFTIDLKSALKAANATELPTDRAVMGIYKINGTKVSKPRQEQDITAGDKVDYIYYIPTGAAVLAYDLDANGAFRSSPDVTVTPVTVSGYTGFYIYSVTYSSGGTFQPLMKVRINGVESTASAPEVNVVPAGVSAITVAVSPQTTTTEVNKSVSLTATITGDYDSIKWQKVQGPASPASVGGSSTNKFSFTLPTAGTYTRCSSF